MIDVYVRLLVRLVDLCHVTRGVIQDLEPILTENKINVQSMSLSIIKRNLANVKFGRVVMGVPSAV